MFKGGFIGFGRMGITHFAILNNHPGVNIVAVCDQSKTMLNILQKYVQVTMYTDYREMIDREQLDFVIVSTPTSSHTEIITTAVQRGLHCFVEKPFSLSTSDGRKALESLAGKALANQVGYVNRFCEVFMEVKRLIEGGLIGDIRQFSSEMYSATVLKDAKSSWRGKRQTGGGCMYEMASHCIDLAIYLVGQPDTVSGSVLQSIYSSAVEDMVTATFLFSSGYSGRVQVNWSDASYRKPSNTVSIFGTLGKIIANKYSYRIFLREDRTDLGFHQGWNTRYLTDVSRNVRFYVRGNEFTRQLDYFIKCIEQGATENISSFADAYQTDIVIEQILMDAEQSGSVIQAPKQERTPAWRKLFK